MPYYAVARGKTPGIFLNWSDCKFQVRGFDGARYKKCNTISEAEQFLYAEGVISKVSLGLSTSDDSYDGETFAVQYFESEATTSKQNVSYTKPHLKRPYVFSDSDDEEISAEEYFKNKAKMRKQNVSPFYSSLNLNRPFAFLARNNSNVGQNLKSIATSNKQNVPTYHSNPNLRRAFAFPSSSNNKETPAQKFLEIKDRIRKHNLLSLSPNPYRGKVFAFPAREDNIDEETSARDDSNDEETSANPYGVSPNEPNLETNGTSKIPPKTKADNLELYEVVEKECDYKNEKNSKNSERRILEEHQKKSLLIDRPGDEKDKEPDLSKPNKEFLTDSDGYVHVYTYSVCSANGRKGAQAGLGVYWGDEHHMNVSEPVSGRAKNNCIEIQAATKSIKQAIDSGITKLTINTHSYYLIMAVTQWMTGWKSRGWKLASGQPVKNEADFKDLDSVQNKINVRWNHLDAKKRNHGNEMAQILAKGVAASCGIRND